MQFIDNLKIKYQAINSSKKVAIILGLFLVGVLFSIYLSYPGGNKKQKQKHTTQGGVKLQEDNFVKEKWLHSASQKIRILQQQVEELQKKLDKKEQKKEKSNVNEAESIDIIAQRIEKMMQNAPVKKPVKIEDITPPSPIAKTKEKSKIQPATHVKQNSVTDKIVNKVIKRRPQTEKKTMHGKQNKKLSKPQSMAVINIPDSEQNDTDKNGNLKNKKLRLYIPSTTFVKGILLTGLDAPTGVKATKTPHPVLMRLQNLSFLPNEVQQNLIGCRVLGEGYGELSSEKAYIRLVKLSCVDVNSHQVVDIPVKGYVVGRDGKIGLRGPVVSKQGMFLARSLTSAFIEGIAQGFKTTQQTIVTTDSGTVTTTPIDGFKDGFVTGFSSGAAKSAEKLSDFYMKLAEEMFPIIEIGARRHVTIVFTAPVDTSFEVKFEQKNMEG